MAAPRPGRPRSRQQGREGAACPPHGAWAGGADPARYQALASAWQSYYKAQCNFMPCFLLPWSTVSALFAPNEKR